MNNYYWFEFYVNYDLLTLTYLLFGFVLLEVRNYVDAGMHSLSTCLIIDIIMNRFFIIILNEFHIPFSLLLTSYFQGLGLGLD